MTAHPRIPGALRGSLRLGLIIGLAVDGFVGLLTVFAQGLVPHVLDVPVRDPALTRIFGGEMLVAAAVYVLPLVDLRRFAPALWICALDQGFAAVLPLIEILRSGMPATWKTIGPIPIDAFLCVLFVVGAHQTRARTTPSTRQEPSGLAPEYPRGR